VDDLKEELAGLRERALDPGAMDDTTSDKVVFATVTDPEGNAITQVEQRSGRRVLDFDECKCARDPNLSAR
jgi:hypothetical protein